MNVQLDPIKVCLRLNEMKLRSSAQSETVTDAVSLIQRMHEKIQRQAKQLSDLQKVKAVKP